MLITLNIQGPPKMVLFTPFPDDNAVSNFREIFRKQINDDILVAEIESRSGSELDKNLLDIPKIYKYNTILIVSHGTEDHKIAMQDSVLALSGRIKDWADWYKSAFDDKLLLFAACHSGDELNTDPLLHIGMALHVVAPNPANPRLKVSQGAAAFANFVNALKLFGNVELTPDHLTQAETETNNIFPNVIKLWPYKASPEFIEQITKDLEDFENENYFAH